MVPPSRRLCGEADESERHGGRNHLSARYTTSTATTGASPARRKRIGSMPSRRFTRALFGPARWRGEERLGESRGEARGEARARRHRRREVRRARSAALVSEIARQTSLFPGFRAYQGRGGPGPGLRGSRASRGASWWPTAAEPSSETRLPRNGGSRLRRRKACGARKAGL